MPTNTGYIIGRLNFISDPENKKHLPFDTMTVGIDTNKSANGDIPHGRLFVNLPINNQEFLDSGGENARGQIIVLEPASLSGKESKGRMFYSINAPQIYLAPSDFTQHDCSSLFIVSGKVGSIEGRMVIVVQRRKMIRDQNADPNKYIPVWVPEGITMPNPNDWIMAESQAVNSIRKENIDHHILVADKIFKYTYIQGGNNGRELSQPRPTDPGQGGDDGTLL